MAVMTGTLIDTMRHISELLRSGNFESAHAQLEAIVSANPEFVEGLRLLAGTKLARGDPLAAEELLRRALAIDPSWPPTLATLGELLLGSGRSSEAETLLQRAATGSRPYPHAALLLARYYNDTGRPNEALAIVAPICLAGKADAELASQHVGALVALGRQQEAVAIYRGLAAASSGDPAAAQALATALSATGQYEEVQRIAQHTIARGYRPASLYNTYARSLIAQGALPEAESALRDSLKIDPRQADAHNNLSQLIWMRTGDLSQATQALDQALQTFTNDDALWATKAAILQGAGNARAAYECLAQRAARAEGSPTLLVRAGLAALEFDAATAMELAERAMSMLPASAAARKLLVAGKLGTGDARGALTHCEALLAGTPDDQYLIALQTTAWRLLGDERYGQLCDYAQLVVPAQLEVPQGWPDLATFLADVKSSLGRLHDPLGHALLFQSLRRGTETTQDLSRSPDPAVRALFGAFAGPIERYIARMGPGTDPLRRRKSVRWRFNGSWSVRLRTSGFHTNHVHPRGWISSACYIDLPESMRDADTQDGVLTFAEPSIPTTPRLAAEYFVRPTAGMLVLFPSYFWHGTVPFSGSQTRLTVAFDAIPER
ncbi:MAG TPA: tetratricopeptide repeat protein [Steroidobacteraceae bacterium]|nr:tetratricopeptide repeat protein [Steroidobacteraceae bacterium]